MPWSAAITSSSTSLGRVVSGVVWPDPVSPCTVHVCHVSHVSRVTHPIVMHVEAAVVHLRVIFALPQVKQGNIALAGLCHSDQRINGYTYYFQLLVTVCGASNYRYRGCYECFVNVTQGGNQDKYFLQCSSKVFSCNMYLNIVLKT